MRISKGFIKTSVIYTVAGMLPMASALILLPFYIPYLTTDLFGELAAYSTFSLLVQIFVTFSFDSSIYIHFHEFKSDKHKLSVFISSAFIFMILIGVVVGLILTLSGNLIFSLMEKQQITFYPYGLASVGAGIFQSIFKVHSSLLQSREKPEVFLWSNIISFLFIGAFTIGGLKLFPQTLAGPVIGRLIASVLMGTWALGRIFREFGFHTDFTWLKSSLSFNVYSFIYQLQLWVVNYLDRVLLLFYIEKSDVGVYDFAIKCLVLTELLLNGLHNSFYPKVVSGIMAQPVKGSSPEINRYYHGLTAVIMVVICLSIVVFPWAIENLVHKPDWKESIPYIPYLAVIYVFRIMRLYFAVPYGILKLAKPMPVMYMVVAVLKIGGIVILVQRYEVYGVIASAVIASIAELILLRMNLKGKFHFRFNVYKIIIAPCALLVLVLVMEPLFGTTHRLWIHIFYLLFCLLMLGWAFRKEVKLIDPWKLIK